MNPDDLAGSKAKLRKSLSAWRSQFGVHLAEHPTEREQFQRGFREQLQALCTEHRAQRVACYLPFGGEPDTTAFNKWAMDARLELLLPIANADNTLHWVVFDGVSTKPSIFGFDEPHGAITSLDPVDLIVVPALAIDERGNRLGKGKGYYDRALADSNAPVVAVVYEHELLEALPAEAHDRPVDFVVTPLQTIQFGAQV